MTNEEKVQEWISISDEDIEIAEVVLKSRHYLHVAFMCQQAIEKIFKGYYEKLKEETPPYTHKLLVLAEKGGFYDSLSEKQRDIIYLVENYYINTRYPADKAKLAKSLTADKCKEILERTKEILQWTKEKISLKK